MTDPKTPRELTRRSFLSDVAVSATGAVALSALVPGAAQASAPEAAAAEWDLTWIDKLTAKYRTVFDAPEINEGTIFTNATVFMMSFAEVYKATDADMQAVLVIRHNAVPLAFNDAMWEKYGIAKDLGLTTTAKGNPYTRELANLKGRGAILLACNLAASRRSREIARRMNADAETVRADIYANLVPGVIMQHSGVFATIRAQQAGCAFMKSG
jgi:hypothetical protein